MPTPDSGKYYSFSLSVWVFNTGHIPETLMISKYYDRFIGKRDFVYSRMLQLSFFGDASVSNILAKSNT